jgi:hypothetical protein
VVGGPRPGAESLRKGPGSGATAGRRLCWLEAPGVDAGAGGFRPARPCHGPVVADRDAAAGPPGQGPGTGTSPDMAKGGWRGHAPRPAARRGPAVPGLGRMPAGGSRNPGEAAAVGGRRKSGSIFAVRLWRRAFGVGPPPWAGGGEGWPTLRPGPPGPSVRGNRREGRPVSPRYRVPLASRNVCPERAEGVGGESLEALAGALDGRVVPALGGGAFCSRLPRHRRLDR